MFTAGKNVICFLMEKNPARKAVEVGSLFHMEFYTSKGWLFGISEPSNSSCLGAFADSWSRRFAVNPQLRQLQISGFKGLQTTKCLGNATKNVCDVFVFQEKRCHVFFTGFLLEQKNSVDWCIDIAWTFLLAVFSSDQRITFWDTEPRRHVVSPWGVRSYDDSDRVWKIRAYDLGGQKGRKEASAVDAMAQLLGRFGHPEWSKQLGPCFFFCLRNSD